MRLIEESAYDPATKSRLALACETTLRIVVRDRPRQAWNARLLEEIQRAVLERTAAGERDLERLVSHATTHAQNFVSTERLRLPRSRVA